jgi:Uncharacterised nucleotidyltransferase
MPAVLTPEFLLTAACCRWPPSPARDTAIHAAAAGVTDWAHFLWLLNRHRVVGLVHDALVSGRIALPSAVAQELKSRAERIARQSLNLAAETVRLQKLFETAGIAALALKGIPLAQLAYGGFSTKHARDIDFLIAPDHAEAALQMLESASYALSLPVEHLNARQRRALVRYAREVEVIDREREVRVELQWHAVENPLLLQGVDAASPAQIVPLSDGLSVRTLARDDLFAFLCVHGARHAWSRLKWLADLNAFAAASGADTEHFYRHAQKIGAGLCAGQALLLCRRLFDFPLPVGLAAEIEANSRVVRLVAIALDAITAPRTRTEADGDAAGVMRGVYEQFLLGEGWAFYVMQCRLLSAGPADVIRLQLPPELHFLYPIVRLPLWLWRRAALALGRSRGGDRPRRAQ